jgi:hypothetical protein
MPAGQEFGVEAAVAARKGASATLAFETLAAGALGVAELRGGALVDDTPPPRPPGPTPALGSVAGGGAVVTALRDAEHAVTKKSTDLEKKVRIRSAG